MPFGASLLPLVARLASRRRHGAMAGGLAAAMPARAILQQACSFKRRRFDLPRSCAFLALMASRPTRDKAGITKMRDISAEIIAGQFIVGRVSGVTSNFERRSVDFRRISPRLQATPLPESIYFDAYRRCLSIFSVGERLSALWQSRPRPWSQMKSGVSQQSPRHVGQ